MGTSWIVGGSDMLTPRESRTGGCAEGANMAMTPERFRHIVWQSVPAVVFTVAATMLALGADGPWAAVGAGAAAAAFMLALAWRQPNLPPEDMPTTLDL